MGRKSSDTSGMNVAEKQATPLAQRLNRLIVDGNALKDYLGVSAQAINQYRLGMARPSLENLCKIAEFYGVSTDYLLGLTDTPSIKEDIQAACKTTGLSEDAIYFLEAMKNIEGEKGQDIFKAINTLLSESNYGKCFDFWERISVFLFSPDKPYNLQAGNTFREMSAETVLSLLLTENDQLLREMRRELQKNGKH